MHTKRLALEPLRLEHADEMVVVLADPGLYAYTGGKPPTLEELRARYRRQARGRSDDGTAGWLNWVVWSRTDGAAVGYVQATLTMDAGQGVAELAWVIGAAHQRRGYAREAVAAVAGWLTDEGVVRLVAHVRPAHAASAGVARSIGLVPTATVVDGAVRWESAPRRSGRPGVGAGT